MRKKLHINGMTCQNCVKHVTEALSEDIAGVKVIEVNLENKYAMVDAPDNTPDSTFKDVIVDLGYELVGIE